MSKSPAFQWYAADYLADERVMLMSLEAEGAYVRLLSLCWREGSIPANPSLLAAMCKQADPKVIKEVLPCFTKSGAPSGRLVHKRLEEERAKQLAHRTKQAENGRNGGRPKKAVGKPNETQKNPPLFIGETQTEPNESSSISSSTSSSKTAVAVVGEQAAGNPSAVEIPAQPTEQKGAGGPREFWYDEAPVFQMNAFFAFVDSIGYKQVDKGLYLLQIQAVGKEKMIHTTDEKWRAFIRSWLNNDKRDGKLMLPVADSQLSPHQQQQRLASTATVAVGDLNARLENQKTKSYL